MRASFPLGIAMLFFLMYSIPILQVPAYANTACCSLSTQTTASVASNGGTTGTLNAWSSDQTPTNKFWTVGVFAGTSGGISTEPAYFIFNLDDANSGSYTGNAACSDTKNDWLVTSNTLWNCSMSAYLPHSMNVLLSFTNYDPTYARTYEYDAHAGYN